MVLSVSLLLLFFLICGYTTRNVGSHSFPDQGWNLRPPALKCGFFNNWTAREVPNDPFYNLPPSTMPGPPLALPPSSISRSCILPSACTVRQTQSSLSCSVLFMQNYQKHLHYCVFSVLFCEWPGAVR